MNIAVEVINSQDQRKFMMDNIPPEIWNSFVEECKNLRPDVENPALAWAACFGDFIDSVAAVDRKVIILRDIPIDDMEIFSRVCAQANTDPVGIIIEIIKSAVKGKFYLGRYAVKRDGKMIRGNHAILLTGITDKAMKPLINLYATYKISVAKLFATWFAQIEQGKMDIKIWQDQSGKNIPYNEESIRNDSEVEG